MGISCGHILWQNICLNSRVWMSRGNIFWLSFVCSRSSVPPLFCHGAWPSGDPLAPSRSSVPPPFCHGAWPSGAPLAGPALLLQKNRGSRFRGYPFGPELSLLLTMGVWFRGCRVVTRSCRIAPLLLQKTLGPYFGATSVASDHPPPPIFLFAFTAR